MSYQAKRQYLIAILERYQKSTKSEKGRILDEFCAVCGYSRKYAIRILNSNLRPERKSLGRRPAYSEGTVRALRDIWHLTGRICSKRLKPALPEWIEWYIKRHHFISNEDVRAILKMSPATIDRKLKKFRAYDLKGKSTTRKNNWWFRTHIPIKADNSGLDQPGFIQADTVAHCGADISGEYAHTVTATDILTTWTENHAIWRKQATGITEAFENIETRFPFPFVILKTDSGSEFMNDKVFTFLTCRDFPIDLVRSRPYQSNDNCYVEQKNFTHVRTAFGYSRLEHPVLVNKMNEIYQDYWNPLYNFFIPSMKLLKKEKLDSKWKKDYDAPKTPYQRVIDCDTISDEQKHSLQQRKKALNPIELRLGLEGKLKEFFDLCKQIAVDEQIKLAA